MKKFIIEEVKSKSDLNQFIAFPDRLYKGNAYRVPQLHNFERSVLRKDKKMSIGVSPKFGFLD